LYGGDGGPNEWQSVVAERAFSVPGSSEQQHIPHRARPALHDLNQEYSEEEDVPVVIDASELWAHEVQGPSGAPMAEMWQDDYKAGLASKGQKEEMLRMIIGGRGAPDGEELTVPIAVDRIEGLAQQVVRKLLQEEIQQAAVF